MDTQLQSPRPLSALKSRDYLLWPIYILTAGRQDVLKWRGRPSRDCSPSAPFQFGWGPSMSIFEGCLRPDWQKQLWSLEAKGSSWVLLLPARPGRQSRALFREKSYQDNPSPEKTGQGSASWMVALVTWLESRIPPLGSGKSIAQLRMDWVFYFLVFFFRVFIVWCLVLWLCFWFCFCRSATWKQSVFQGLRGFWEDQWRALFLLLEGEEEEEEPSPRRIRA